MKPKINFKFNPNLKEKFRKPQISERVKSLYVPLQLRGEKLNLKKPQHLLLLLSAVAVVAAVAIVMLTLNFGSSYTLEEKGYQCYGGNTVELESGVKLKRNSEDKTLLIRDGEGSETFLPIYLLQEPAMVLSNDMLLFTPRENGVSRVSYFSKVSCDKYGAVAIEKNGKTEKTEQGFLYDGNDFYIFLEPVTLKFNGYSMKLPALSYVEAVYGGYMTVYNYETKEFFIELSDGTGSASVPSGDYEISLMGDSMTLYDGSRKLLATRPDLFDPIV